MVLGEGGRLAEVILYSICMFLQTVVLILKGSSERVVHMGRKTSIFLMNFNFATARDLNKFLQHIKLLIVHHKCAPIFALRLYVSTMLLTFYTEPNIWLWDDATVVTFSRDERSRTLFFFLGANRKHGVLIRCSQRAGVHRSTFFII